MGPGQVIGAHILQSPCVMFHTGSEGRKGRPLLNPTVFQSGFRFFDVGNFEGVLCDEQRHSKSSSEPKLDPGQGGAKAGGMVELKRKWKSDT